MSLSNYQSVISLCIINDSPSYLNYLFLISIAHFFTLSFLVLFFHFHPIHFNSHLGFVMTSAITIICLSSAPLVITINTVAFLSCLFTPSQVVFQVWRSREGTGYVWRGGWGAHRPCGCCCCLLVSTGKYLS